jgi:hypothetical protein
LSYDKCQIQHFPAQNGLMMKQNGCVPIKGCPTLNHHQSSTRQTPYQSYLLRQITQQSYFSTQLYQLTLNRSVLLFFFQHFTKTLTCIFLAKRNLVFFRDHSRLGLSLFLLRIYIGKEGSLHHPRLILLTPSVNRIKGITIVRQSIPHSFPYTFCKELRKTFWIILFTVIFQ